MKKFLRSSLVLLFVVLGIILIQKYYERTKLVDLSWSTVPEATHYEVYFGEKGIFNKPEIVVNYPQEKLSSAKIIYPKNKPFIATVRACNNKGVSEMAGIIFIGMDDFEQKTERCKFEDKVSVCKILYRDGEAYIFIDTGKLEEVVWDRAFYHKFGEPEIKEFKIESEEAGSMI